MTTFQSVNIGLGPKDYDATTPTTPRAPSIAPSRPNPAPANEDSAPATPTMLTFVGIEGQRPLPSSPFSSSFSSQQSSQSSTKKAEAGILTRGNSHQSTQSTESQDVEMDDSDDGEGNSEGESIDGETGRPSKKKKGQRFFCTDFPPCNLSFTRSEHLARHIRKHTGERPFQCHCSRRFSRLDNLRQHAQTVHVNEEIPGDSLAATGTRFQRQIRTDRVRTPTGRSRASTASSQGSHGRGHSRNLSASSIGSTSSTVSRDDSRRRPQPLMMASDPSSRSRLTLDTMRAQASTPPAQYGNSRDSSDGVSTPTSTTFSNGPNSPGYGSSLGSPLSNVPRNLGLWGNSTHGRRLSVPSGPNPFQSPHGNSYPPPYLSPLAPSNSSHLSNNSSVYGSPTTSTYSFSRRDSTLAAEAEWRRRTWHPSTYTNYTRPATSGLSYYQNADAPRPAFAPQAIAAVSQLHRLPGIETFDQITHRPTTPPHRGPSPMQVDSPGRPPIYSGPSEQTTTGPNDRRGHASWDKSLHHNLTKLHIANGTPQKDAGLWSQQTLAEMHEAVARPPEPQVYQPSLAPSVPQSSQAPQVLQPAPIIIHQEAHNRPVENTYLQPITSNKKKRHGWYNGPLANTHRTTLQQRTSPEDSSSSDGVPTPSFASGEYHPSIVHSNGVIEPNNLGAPTPHIYNTGHARPPPYPIPSEPGVMAASQHSSSKNNSMSGLEVLVAVATGEEKATALPTH